MAWHHGRRRGGQRGFTLILYTLMLFFIIIPSVGLAIDAGIMYYIKGKLQTAVDGAALGAARSLSRGQDIPTQKPLAEDTAKRYFHANFPNNWMGVTPVNDPTVTWPTAPAATAIINVQADVDAPTWFMRIFGINTLHFTVVGEATRRNVNVMLVIDRSTSLNDSGSCGALSSDAQLFVSSFSNNRDRMAMVTFGTYYNLDFPFNFDFQSGLTTKLASLQCSGFTNAAAAFWVAYQAIKAQGDQNALNVMLFFTDGIPNTMTFGTVPATGGIAGTAASGTLLPLKAGSSCNATPGFSGVIAGDISYNVTGGIFKPTNTTYPAPAPFPGDITVIGSTEGNKGGCAFPGTPYGSPQGSFPSDVAYMPSSDAFGNATDTSVLGGTGFPLAVSRYGSGAYSGKIRVDVQQTLENAGVNALDNSAQRARADASSSNLPLVVYTIGLGNSGGVNDELLKRIANDPSALAHQTAYADGIYIYTPDTAHLSAAFATIASDILRISR